MREAEGVPAHSAVGIGGRRAPRRRRALMVAVLALVTAGGATAAGAGPALRARPPGPPPAPPPAGAAGALQRRRDRGLGPPVPGALPRAPVGDPGRGDALLPASALHGADGGVAHPGAACRRLAPPPLPLDGGRERFGDDRPLPPAVRRRGVRPAPRVGVAGVRPRLPAPAVVGDGDAHRE